MKYYIILIIAVCFSCSNEFEELEIGINKRKDGNIINLSFSTNKELDTLIVDMNSLNFCNYEAINMDTCNNINDIANTITKSQFVIENKKGEYRLFSSFFILENESKDFPDVNCFPYEYQRLSLLKGSKKTIQKEIYLSDLMVTKKDETIRLWYIYIPDSVKIKDSRRIIKSNWMKIY